MDKSLSGTGAKRPTATTGGVIPAKSASSMPPQRQAQFFQTDIQDAPWTKTNAAAEQAPASSITKDCAGAANSGTALQCATPPPQTQCRLLPVRQTLKKHSATVHDRSQQSCPASAAMGSRFGLCRFTAFFSIGIGGMRGTASVPCAGCICLVGVRCHHCQLFGGNSLGPGFTPAPHHAARSICVGCFSKFGSVACTANTRRTRALNDRSTAGYMPGF